MDRRLFVSIIVSLFAALATGILLGGELAADPNLIAEQGRLLEGAEREFERLRSDTHDLQSQLAEMELLLADHRLALQQLAQRATAGMLTDLTVAIVSCGDTDTAAQAEAALTHAGAALRRRITIDRSALDFPGEEDPARWLAGIDPAQTATPPPWVRTDGDRLLNEVDAIILSIDDDIDGVWSTITGQLGSLGPRLIVIGTSERMTSDAASVGVSAVIANVGSPSGIVALCDAVKGGD